MLAGSIREAVRGYVAEFEEPERLIIHYYKQMSYRERKPVMHMLHNDLELDDTEVVVVTINKTQSRDIVLFDDNYNGKMPMSGTFMRLDEERFLLCNNTRYPSQNGSPRNYPFPLKIRIATDNAGIRDDEVEIEQILTQVYQFSRIY